MSRRGLLDAVVFSGGEPLAQAALIPAMARVKEMDFKVGLHTSGVYPARFAEALAFADWVGLDVKTGFDGYDSVTGIRSSGAWAQESLTLLLASGVDHEVRTTVSPRAHTPASLMALATELRCAGVKRYAVQEERAVAHASVKREALALADLHTELSALFESFAYRCA